MKGILASGILFLVAFTAIGLAGGFVPLWDDHPWECGEFCSYQPSIATSPRRSRSRRIVAERAREPSPNRGTAAPTQRKLVPIDCVHVPIQRRLDPTH